MLEFLTTGGVFVLGVLVIFLSGVGVSAREVLFGFILFLNP